MPKTSPLGVVLDPLFHPLDCRPRYIVLPSQHTKRHSCRPSRTNGLLLL